MLTCLIGAMGHREAFIGTRAAFLNAQRDAYAAAVIGNHIPDCIADIQRRYFKRYPINLDHDVEPTPESLATVDDTAADIESLSPDEDSMTPEAYSAAVKVFEARQQLIKYRKSVSDGKSFPCLDYLSHFDSSSKSNAEWRICMACTTKVARHPARQRQTTTPWTS